LLACIAEEHHDEHGLIWPITVAPYHVHLALLPGSAPGGQAESAATRLYDQLQAAGVEVLLDDRVERPGVKFNDADLIGLPLRLTVGERSLGKGGAELKRRTGKADKDSVIVPLDEVVERVKSEIRDLQAEIAAKLVEMPFKD